MTTEDDDLVLVGRDFTDRKTDRSFDATDNRIEVLGGPNVFDPGIPRTLVELSSGEGSISRSYTTQVATKLSIPFLPIDASGEHSVFVQEYSKYRDIPQLSGRLRYGVAVRWIITVVKLNGNAKTDAANLIAASVEFGYARTSARFEVVGMQGKAITALVPAPDNLTVDQYALFAQRLSAIKDLMWDPATIITPTLLSASQNLIGDV